MLQVRGQTRFGQYVSVPPADEVRIEGLSVFAGNTLIMTIAAGGWLISNIRVSELEVIGMLELTCVDEHGKTLKLGLCRFVHLHGPLLVSDLAHLAEYSEEDQSWHLDGYGRACGALILRQSNPSEVGPAL